MTGAREGLSSTAAHSLPNASFLYIFPDTSLTLSINSSTSTHQFYIPWKRKNETKHLEQMSV